MAIERFVSKAVMTPIGPYCHMTKVGSFVAISGLAGVDPSTEMLAGKDVYTQTMQILKSFKHLLGEIGADFQAVTHVHVFLRNMDDFEEMNRAYAESFGPAVPARTVIGVLALPKKDALVTMNLNAILADVIADREKDHSSL